MENMDQNNVNVTSTPVEVPEQAKANKRFDKSLVIDGVKLGAGAAAGASAVYGAVVGIYYAAKWVGKVWNAGKVRRAEKKAAKQAEKEKANEKPSKKKAGEA